jgi:hypothetical protein
MTTYVETKSYFRERHVVKIAAGRLGKIDGSAS